MPVTGLCRTGPMGTQVHGPFPGIPTIGHRRPKYVPGASERRERRTTSAHTVHSTGAPRCWTCLWAILHVHHDMDCARRQRHPQSRLDAPGTQQETPARPGPCRPAQSVPESPSLPVGPAHLLTCPREGLVLERQQRRAKCLHCFPGPFCRWYGPPGCQVDQPWRALEGLGSRRSMPASIRPELQYVPHGRHWWVLGSITGPSLQTRQPYCCHDPGALDSSPPPATRTHMLTLALFPSPCPSVAGDRAEET